MHGVPHGKANAKVKKLSKTKRRPTALFAGILCTKCRSLVACEAAKIEAGAKKPKEVEHNPVCPYCETEISHLDLHPWQIKGLVLREMGRIGAFSCPNCKKILGVASIAWGKE